LRRASAVISVWSRTAAAAVSEATTGRNQAADNHVFLQAAQVVFLAHDGGFGEHKFHFVGAAEQVVGQIFGNFYVEALAFAVGIHIAEGGLVAEHADADYAALFDFGQSVIAGGTGSSRSVGCAAAGSRLVAAL